MQTDSTVRIVVGVDGSQPSLSALEWAARQAEFTAATLEAITTWEWPTSYGWTPPWPQEWSPGADAQKLLDEALEGVRRRHPSIEVNPRVVEGHAAPILVEASRGADLLAVGSRGHGEFAGMLLGSVSEHCVTNAHCPVLVMRCDD